MREYILFFLTYIFALNNISLIGQNINEEMLYIDKIIPKENSQILFGNAIDMDFDDGNNYYILDNKQNNIFKFNSKDELLGKIGRKGKGPGEFSSPYLLSYYDNKIAVLDYGNYKMNFFSKEGEYLSSFSVLFFINDILLYKDNLYLSITYDKPSGVPGSVIKRQLSLINVFNLQGEIINSFGMFPFDDEYTTVLSATFLKIYNNEIYALFKRYPILHKYSLNGQLKGEFHFNANEDDYKKRIEPNYNFSKLKKNQGSHNAKFLFRAFDVNEDGIFVTIMSEDLIIDHYDFSGEFITRYRKNHLKDYKFYVWDLKVKKVSDKSYKFYVLKREKYSTLDIYVNKP